MFNSDLKNSALRDLESANRAYQKSAKSVNQDSEKLYTLRQESSQIVIGSVEKYVNTLANTPKEFDRTFSVFRAEYQTFSQILHQLNKEAESVNVKAGGISAGGVATGVGVAAFAPTAAMAIATTFGAASTGTAISALSGAAATNAALAWLGGGALAAGGGGMVAGNALLALAGPIGWAIGGTALVGGALFASSKNKDIAENANKERKRISVLNKQLETALHEIDRLCYSTTEHVNGMKKLLQLLKNEAPLSYNQFSPINKEWLSSLVNHVYSLSVLLNKKVDA